MCAAPYPVTILGAEGQQLEFRDRCNFIYWDWMKRGFIAKKISTSASTIGNFHHRLSHRGLFNNKIFGSELYISIVLYNTSTKRLLGTKTLTQRWWNNRRWCNYANQTLYLIKTTVLDYYSSHLALCENKWPTCASVYQCLGILIRQFDGELKTGLQISHLVGGERYTSGHGYQKACFWHSTQYKFCSSNNWKSHSFSSDCRASYTFCDKLPH